MKQIVEQFVCNLKEDVAHALGDQLTYWALIRPTVLFFNVHSFMSQIEFWLFMHGWLILLIWRLFNAAIDTWKRLRDIEKPEWKSQVVPLIREEARRNQRMGFFKKLWRFLRQMF